MDNYAGGGGMSLGLAGVCSGACRWCLRRLRSDFLVSVIFKS